MSIVISPSQNNVFVGFSHVLLRLGRRPRVTPCWCSCHKEMGNNQPQSSHPKVKQPTTGRTCSVPKFPQEPYASFCNKVEG